MRTAARFTVIEEGLDAMAINHPRQSSPNYVPRTWRLYKESDLTHTVEPRYS
jgi:hypothetical protein